MRSVTGLVKDLPPVQANSSGTSTVAPTPAPSAGNATGNATGPPPAGFAVLADAIVASIYDLTGIHLVLTVLDIAIRVVPPGDDCVPGRLVPFGSTFVESRAYGDVGDEHQVPCPDGMNGWARLVCVHPHSHDLSARLFTIAAANCLGPQQSCAVSSRYAGWAIPNTWRCVMR